MVNVQYDLKTASVDEVLDILTVVEVSLMVLSNEKFRFANIVPGSDRGFYDVVSVRHGFKYSTYRIRDAINVCAEIDRMIRIERDRLAENETTEENKEVL